MQFKQGENYAMRPEKTKRQCQNWFAKFRKANFNLEDALRPGRPLEADVNKIKSSSNNNSRDCRKIKSVKRDNLEAHETSRINF